MNIRRAILGLAISLACHFSAQAEIKILNCTGDELKVDVLHSSGQARDVAIPKAPAVSEPIGAKNPRRTSMMLVLKSASGQELARGEVFSEALVLVTKGTSGYKFAPATGYFKGPAEHGYVKVINATEQELQYSYEEPNFSLKTGKCPRETSDGKFMIQCRVVVSDGPYRAGQEVKVKIGVGQPPSGNPHNLVAGGVYYATLADGQLKLEKVAND